MDGGETHDRRAVDALAINLSGGRRDRAITATVSCLTRPHCQFNLSWRYHNWRQNNNLSHSRPRISVNWECIVCSTWRHLPIAPCFAACDPPISAMVIACHGGAWREFLHAWRRPREPGKPASCWASMRWADPASVCQNAASCHVVARVNYPAGTEAFVRTSGLPGRRVCRHAGVRWRQLTTGQANDDRCNPNDSSGTCFAAVDCRLAPAQARAGRGSRPPPRSMFPPQLPITPSETAGRSRRGAARPRH